MSNTFITSVVGVCEESFPSWLECFGVDYESVILRGDVAWELCKYSIIELGT